MNSDYQTPHPDPHISSCFDTQVVVSILELMLIHFGTDALEASMGPFHTYHERKSHGLSRFVPDSWRPSAHS